MGYLAENYSFNWVGLAIALWVNFCIRVLLAMSGVPFEGIPPLVDFAADVILFCGCQYTFPHRFKPFPREDYEDVSENEDI